MADFIKKALDAGKEKFNSVQDEFEDITVEGLKQKAKTAILGEVGFHWIDTKQNLGKVNGYSMYLSRSGAANFIGGRTSKMTIDPINIQVTPFTGIDYEKQIDPYIDGFQKGKLESLLYTNSDSYSDPTFLIFDLAIDYNNSPFFNDKKGGMVDYLDEYKDIIPELKERIDMYDVCRNSIYKLFPTKGDPATDTNKSHYIQSISNLDVLFKKIIKFPEDKITFTLSEDITLFAQRLSELYNNLTYSYDTQRYLIPDNLLLFDLRIEFSDVRSMVKKKSKNTTNLGVSKYENKNLFNKSKFVYILHDCSFNFDNSRSFGTTVTRGGWGVGVDTNPATMTFDIIFKSYSKISVDGFNNRKLQVLDYKKRENEKVDYYQTDVSIEDQRKLDHIKIIDVKDGLLGKLKKAVIGELLDVRSVLLNKAKEQAQKLADRAQQAIADRLGISVTKFNVYIDSPANALDKVSQFVGDFTDKMVDNINSSVFGDTQREPVQYKDGNVYEGAVPPPPKLPSNEVVFKGNYNKKYPDDEKIFKDSIYNQKFPSGNLQSGSTYNQKFPSGDLMDNGKYNQKFPSGDLHLDGIYNQKFPDGDVHPDGTYNQKFPDGDVHPDGKYNEKYPDGDVHPDGKYNEKYPTGDIHPDGKYNEKYPDGDVHPDGKYNEKYPDGDVHPDGKYNEKYPTGDLMEKGTYNQKLPSGDLMEKGTYNQKLPTDDSRFEKGTYNQKLPSGDLMEKGTYNQKLPNGKLYENNQLTIKFPDDDKLFDNGTYNEKYPTGDLMKNGTYNEKYPNGVVSDKHGQTKIQLPSDNLYGTKKVIDKKPSGNLYKKK